MIINTLINLLKSKGDYRFLPSSLNISGVNFTFDAVLIGPGKSNCYVLIDDASKTDEINLRKKSQMLALILGRTLSPRIVTLVLIIGNSTKSDIQLLEKYCRVILIDPDDILEIIEDKLASLLPLDLPSAVAPVEEADSLLKGKLAKIITEPFVKKLLSASKKSPDYVRKTVLDEIERISKT